MGINKNIGKNTIGDNNKMQVYMHDYNMSTHDLSTITRTSMSPGTLVPTMKLLVQKGDVIDIDIEANVLTHPTVGPLFGGFKLENHLYFGALRLYNSWLHNNRTKIGLDMSQIKLPQIWVGLNRNYDQPTTEDQWTQVNPSCLLAYLGIKGYGSITSKTSTKNVYKNGVPTLMYYDIFKNYYANTQEDNFYIIGNTEDLDITINGEAVNPNVIPSNVGRVNNSANIKIKPNTIKENELQIKVAKGSVTAKSEILTVSEIGNFTVQGDFIEITTNLIPEGKFWYIRAIQTINRTTLEPIPLENIDKMRDLILQYPGNTQLNITSQTLKVPKPYENFRLRKPSNNKLNTTDPQYGLCIKTYNSDLFQNWINTEWIEGIQGVNEISSVDVSDGKLSMDALNLAQKVYNMLNRIVVSGGTYRDWLETVYTGSNYFERCETPIFEGGTSQEIVFQEVISNSASENEPLGTLAGRGITTNKQRGGHIKIKVTEPGYIMCITSITPRIDYSQGNDWDAELKTMDDLHKPALDGIGYQDSINGERAWWADYWNEKEEINQTSVGKTVAWINYMTNVNRTFGNFATGMDEEFMVLNRQYSPKINSDGHLDIEDLTTYIDPVKYNYIFADTNLDAMNFWTQIKFDIKARRLISAKQIPNL
nr:MAG TPA: Major capsid protein [Microviridae sp.]